MNSRVDRSEKGLALQSVVGVQSMKRRVNYGEKFKEAPTVEDFSKLGSSVDLLVE